MTTHGAILVAALALAGCSAAHVPVRSAGADWRLTATNDDRTRLRGWRDTWLAALGRARAAGVGAELTAEGALFEPDAALPGAMPPPGPYRCRLFKLGANGTGAQEFTRYPPFACRIDGAGFDYAAPGRQQVAGHLFADTGTRAVFLGTLGFADERAPPTHGRDPQRDMAGLVERIGGRRWRLVLPRPRFESLLDVIEMTPAD